MGDGLGVEGLQPHPISSCAIRWCFLQVPGTPERHFSRRIHSRECALAPRARTAPCPASRRSLCLGIARSTQYALGLMRNAKTSHGPCARLSVRTHLQVGLRRVFGCYHNARRFSPGRVEVTPSLLGDFSRQPANPPPLPPLPLLTPLPHPLNASRGGGRNEGGDEKNEERRTEEREEDGEEKAILRPHLVRNP